MMNLRKYFVLILVLAVMVLLSFTSSATGASGIDSRFEISKMSDMSGFDPNNVAQPDGDTVKIGVLQPFSGVAAFNGELRWAVLNYVAYDINKRGGIVIDGKKKMVEIVKGDTKGKPADTKKITEKLCLEDNCDFLMGTSGSHLCAVISTVANKYKKVYAITEALAEKLLDAKSFNPYTFRTCLTSHMWGHALGYYYATQPETKFYILCQDYSYGHDMAEAFKEGIKKYKPEAVIVGEDYHPLFHKDYAPYITKIESSGAEVVITGDWPPDGYILYKQARNLGMKLPFANIYITSAQELSACAPEDGIGLVNCGCATINADTPDQKKFVYDWHENWKRWDKPYNSLFYKWPGKILYSQAMDFYWILDVISRAGSTDSEKIIATWEGDRYESLLGVHEMRACDHQAVIDLFVSRYDYPNPWYTESAMDAVNFRVPARYCMPRIPEGLERCSE